MKDRIQELIGNYIREYQRDKEIETQWMEPIVAYASTKDPLFKRLKDLIGPTHGLPEDFLPDSKTVITYFIPFDERIVNSNIQEKMASREWAVAYIETNQLIHDLNQYIQVKLNQIGYKSTIIPATHNFNEEKLISDWSHRHVAYIAGLGNFGINNMLITGAGCCGRIGTIVTDIEIEPTQRNEGETCLYKHNGTCGICIERCVNDALKKDGFNRHKCYAMCLDNSKLYPEIGLADVCGKCLVGVPCSFKNPVK